jgi:polyketide cyclase/dehydrase/lipid transport protein
MMIRHTNNSGGRASARRIFVTMAVIVSALTPLLQAAATESQSPAIVTVHEERGVYLVSARFQVPQSAAVALAVLTDYERIPRFMPDIKTSVVLERTAGHALVEQEGVSHFMMFSKRVHLVLDISEAADALRFRDRCGRSFVSYEGSWKLAAENGGARIVYELRAQPSFTVPASVLKRLLRRDSGRMIESLRQEFATVEGGRNR